MTPEREAASKVLKSYWRSIEIFDRKYAETGDLNYLNQMNHLKKMCKEVLKRHEASAESNKATTKRDKTQISY